MSVCPFGRRPGSPPGRLLVRLLVRSSARPLVRSSDDASPKKENPHPSPSSEALPNLRAVEGGDPWDTLTPCSPWAAPSSPPRSSPASAGGSGLTWTGRRDAFWLACLLGAALVGTALARLVHARAAYRRLTTATGLDVPEPGTGPGDV
ncbi:hypothetical protein [Streptomyces sp. E5N91]|uniref:hypothetical protein n=1 Tax=Streptomyces sp. E5N91 TaxID=1851996 RepID=UPI000EF60EB2|nr:hypothetical protein [Streptomyces sp. E5N91]